MIRLLKWLLRRTAPNLVRYLMRLRILFSVMDRQQHLALATLTGLMMVSSVIGLLSIVSMVPFLTLALAPDSVEDAGLTAWAKNLIGLEDTNQLIIVMGLFSFSILCFQYLFGYLSGLYRLRIEEKLKASFLAKMCGYYLMVPYEFHLQHHSALLMNNIMGKSFAVLGALVHGSLSLVNNLIYLVIGFVVLGINNVYMMSGAGLSMLLLSWYYFRSRKQRIEANAQQSMLSGAQLPKMLLDTLQSVEDIKVSGNEKYFHSKIVDLFIFRSKLRELQFKLGYWFSPMIEVVIYGVLVSIIVLQLLFAAGGSLESIALFGLLLYRMIPRVKSLFPQYIGLKQGTVNFDYIREDLLLAFKKSLQPRDRKRLPFEDKLELRDLVYTYPRSSTPAVAGVSIEIPKGARIGFAGFSGSGKSTLMKLLLGLLQPQQGQVCIDGVPLDEKSIGGWQNQIGYVSQQVVLLDATVAQNVALELDDHSIDRERVNEVLKLVALEDTIGELVDGIDTMVGEKGINFSGGQRQRIAIARALYQQPSVIVFDEATSALDSINEDRVIDGLKEVTGHGQTLIMVAHRITTISDCDIIYCMEDGQIVDSGSYDELIAGNADFRRLAKWRPPPPPIEVDPQ